MTRVKVWPLVRGVPGFNAIGEAKEDLELGLPGYVDESEVSKLVKAEKVQMLAGLDVRQVRAPDYSSKASVEEPVSAQAPAAPAPSPSEGNDTPKPPADHRVGAKVAPKKKKIALRKREGQTGSISKDDEA